MFKRTTLLMCSLVMAACTQESTPPAQEPTATKAAAAAAGTPRYSAEAFYETTSYSLAQYPAWSADGSRLLVASDETGTFNVYALPAEGGKPTALTRATDTARLPVSWFPGDDRVLFKADEGGNELDHLFVREEDGSSQDLTPGENLKAAFLRWSGDREHFYVLTNERDIKAFDLYRYRADNYQRERVFENTGNWAVKSLSPNERYLLLGIERGSSDNDLYLYDFDKPAAEPELITEHEGNVFHLAFDFTADSKALVYGTDAHGEFIEAWTHDIASGEKTPRLQTDWHVQFLFFSDSGRYQVAGINEDANMVIRIEDTESGQPVALPDLPPGQLAQLRFSPDESKLALMISTDTSPRDVYVIDLDAGSLDRLTSAMSADIDEANLVTSEVIRYKSFDGLEIPSILYRPRGASADNPVPALVWVHGGPGGQSTTGYFAMIQHLVNHGYAVLMANNRGSWGYGKTFYQMDDRKHGTVDLDDIVYGGKYLAELDWVDSERIGVIGGSYGGYIVGAALAFRPGAFKVGINIFGVMNWVRTLESMPPYWEALRASLYAELGDPATDRERLMSVSPLAHADKIKTPLLVVQGANDPRVLKVESDEIVAAVKANGVPVDYLVFDDEGHGFSQKANRVAASDAFVSFLEKYL